MRHIYIMLSLRYYLLLIHGLALYGDVHIVHGWMSLHTCEVNALMLCEVNALILLGIEWWNQQWSIRIHMHMYMQVHMQIHIHIHIDIHIYTYSYTYSYAYTCTYTYTYTYTTFMFIRAEILFTNSSCVFIDENHHSTSKICKQISPISFSDVIWCTYFKIKFVCFPLTGCNVKSQKYAGYDQADWTDWKKNVYMNVISLYRDILYQIFWVINRYMLQCWKCFTDIFTMPC